MITVKDYQLTELSLGAERFFIYRVENLVQDLYPDLYKKLAELGGDGYLQTCFEEAKSINIEIEQDVFDYMLLCIEHGIGFYQSRIDKLDLDWLASENVPGQSKVAVLKEEMNRDQTNEHE